MKKLILTILMLTAVTAPLFAQSNSGDDWQAGIDAFAKGEEAVNEGNYELGIKYFTKAIAKRPKDPNNYEERGICYYLLNRYDEAIADMNRALTIDPKFDDARKWIAKIRYDMPDRSEAAQERQNRNDGTSTASRSERSQDNDKKRERDQYSTGSNNRSRQYNNRNSNNNAGANSEKSDAYSQNISFFQTYNGQSERYTIDKNSDAYARKAMKNVLSTEEDEATYLRKMIAYHANNKKGNKEMYHCKETTLRYEVYERGTDKLPTKVRASYEYEEKPGKNYSIEVFFDEGLPYYIWYPDEILYARASDEEGVIGHLNFTPSQTGRIVSLNKRDAALRSTVRASTTNPRINDSLTKLVKTRFPGADCAACLSRTVVPKSVTEKIEMVDGYGQRSYKYETHTRYYIRVQNKCNKPLKVVGISQSGWGTKTYGIVWKTYKAKQISEWERDSNNVLGGVIASMLIGGGEMDDIDLSRINKKYDTENGGEIQYLRIVESK